MGFAEGIVIGIGISALAAGIVYAVLKFSEK